MENWDARLDDKWWRITHLYKIKTKTGEVVIFQPNFIQLKHLAERGPHSRNLILKARQFGFTTLYCIDLLDEALWVPGMTCAITGNDRETLDRIFEIVKRAYDNLAPGIKPRTRTDTVREYEFTHRFDGTKLDSNIYVALKIRGGTVQRLHVTESAFVKDRNELNASTKQAVPVTGSISEETTGNGFNDFSDFYIESKAKKDINPLDYKTYFYAWWENAEYSLPGEFPAPTAEDKLKYGDELAEKSKYNLGDGQLLWRRWKINELRKNQEGVGLTGLQLFKQEYPANWQEAFQAGMGNVFDNEHIEQIQTPALLGKSDVLALTNDPSIQEKFNQLWDLGFSLWKLPDMSTQYVVGCDPSDGEGSDFGVIDVWTKESPEQVAQFYGKVRPDELAEYIKLAAEFYNHAFAGVENNMLTTVLFLSKIYDNYYYEVKVDEKTAKRTKKLGWSTNSLTRDLMIDDFIILFDEGNLIIKSPITLKEMRTFIKNDVGKREHAKGKHDDALFAAFIAMQMRRFYPKGGRTFEKKPEGL